MGLLKGLAYLILGILFCFFLAVGGWLIVAIWAVALFLVKALIVGALACGIGGAVLKEWRDK